MVIEANGRASAPVAIPVTPACPGIFSANSSGSGQGAILNQDGSLNSSGNPAEKGSILVMYGTGEGQTNPPGVDGRLATEVFPVPLADVEVTVGGLPAEVLYAGAAPFFVAGVIQVNARTSPNVASGNQPVIMRIGGAESRPDVTAAIR